MIAMKPLVFFVITICLCVTKTNSQVVVIKIEDISTYMGDSVKICTKIYGGRYLFRMKDKPTHLEVGADYPKNPITIVIWGKDRENFEERPEMMYAYRNACITGKLEFNKDKPQIIVTNPSQIVLQQ